MNPNTWYEVHMILNELGENYIKDLPNELLNYIKTNMRPHSSEIDWNIYEHEFEEETIEFISFLNLRYWCKNNFEKEELGKIYKENERRYRKIVM